MTKNFLMSNKFTNYFYFILQLKETATKYQQTKRSRNYLQSSTLATSRVINPALISLHLALVAAP